MLAMLPSYSMISSSVRTSQLLTVSGSGGRCDLCVLKPAKLRGCLGSFGCDIVGNGCCRDLSVIIPVLYDRHLNTVHE